MEDCLEIHRKIIKNKEREAKIENDSNEVEIKKQEAKRKWWQTYLDVAKWSYPKLITAGVAVCFFAWTLKLPYPHF